jgi:enoyl-CoA hydratase/carnithine racemase
MEAMTNEHILETHEGAICILALNRARKKNALTADMYGGAAAVLAAADADPKVRVAVILGEGGAFCAGNDLADFMNAPPTDASAPVFRFMRELTYFRKPLVAGVQGAAVGIGTTLLLHCDLVYAARDARFSLPFANLGLVPEAASSFLLPRLAGLQRASELLFLGEPFDAETGKTLGFVNAVVEGGELRSTALAAAHKLADKPPAALASAKQLLRAPLLAGMERAMRDESRVFGERLRSPEAKEAFAAFFEKRRPDFSKF